MPSTTTLFIGEREMAASMQDRLDQLDQAIAILQTIRRETHILLMEMFPEAI